MHQRAITQVDHRMILTITVDTDEVVVEEETVEEDQDEVTRVDGNPHQKTWNQKRKLRKKLQFHQYWY